jgi:hypothetical protein
MSNLGRTDVERIIEDVLRELSIQVHDGTRTAPNNRKVELKFKNNVISTAYFDVKQRSGIND